MRVTSAEFDQLDNAEETIVTYHMILHAFVKLDFLSDKDAGYIRDRIKADLSDDPAAFGALAGVEKCLDEGARLGVRPYLGLT